MIDGQCLCGAVTVRAEQTKDFMTACSCEDCRRWTGGVNFTFNVDETTAEITGPVKTISIQPWAERGFCGECGSPLFSHVEVAPGMVWIKAGTLDDTSGFAPTMQIWGKSKQCWLELGDIPMFDTVPDAN